MCAVRAVFYFRVCLRAAAAATNSPWHMTCLYLREFFPFARFCIFHLQFIAFTQIERNFNNILLNTLKSIRRVNVQRLAVQPRYATDAIHSHHTGTHTQYAFDFYLKLLNLRRQLCFAQAISATCPVTTASSVAAAAISLRWFCFTFTCSPSQFVCFASECIQFKR